MLLLKFHEMRVVTIFLLSSALFASLLNLLWVFRILIFFLGIDIERHLLFEFQMLFILLLLLHLSISRLRGYIASHYLQACI